MPASRLPEDPGLRLRVLMKNGIKWGARKRAESRFRVAPKHFMDEAATVAEIRLQYHAHEMTGN